MTLVTGKIDIHESCYAVPLVLLVYETYETTRFRDL